MIDGFKTENANFFINHFAYYIIIALLLYAIPINYITDKAKPKV